MFLDAKNNDSTKIPKRASKKKGKKNITQGNPSSTGKTWTSLFYIIRLFHNVLYFVFFHPSMPPPSGMTVLYIIYYPLQIVR